MIELLSPVGDFECLKAAVQNGADSVYFGGDLFNARASATNFDREQFRRSNKLCKAKKCKNKFNIKYFNKNNEFDEALI